MPEVLLIEDDCAVQDAVTGALASRGFHVHIVGTALDALRWMSGHQPDVVVLDLGLPDLDGTTVLRMLRGITSVPVIIATARSGERDMVDLLDAGADAYIVKPFASEQLAARIHAVLRRATRDDTAGTTFQVGGLHVDIVQHTVHLDGRELVLNRREFELLAYLVARPGLIVSRRELLREVWRQQRVGEDQTIDVHVSWLRRKLGETAANPRYLHTVRGMGIKLEAPR
jgi:DNA-binding response OmpR family regulator